jgi:hypothetical protein
MFSAHAGRDLSGFAKEPFLLDSQLSAVFADPPAFYRGKPFWSWNGTLDEAELKRQARIMKGMGFGGFFMHSRVGLATEYLGDEWFRLINAVADESERLGMEAWLYDEDRWPSGSAGGLATQEARWRMKFLRCRQSPEAGVVWTPEVVAVFAGRVDGVTAGGLRRVASGEVVQLAPGEQVLVFTQETMGDHPFFNGGAYLDTMDAEATARFLAMTHEEYRRRCGDRLKHSIRGIFTDEPHRGFIMSSFGAEGRPEPERTVPWTPRFAASFQERFGYDLTDRLPEIFYRVEGRRLSPVKWQFVEHCQTLFLDHFMKPIQDWCHANGQCFTGHVLHEDSLTSQVVPNGSMQRNYEYMDAPGMDLLSEGNRCYWNAKQVASVARQLGQRQVLSELYGCTGWQMDFNDYKNVGDWQALFGVNLRCPHLSWYTMQGEAKRDYPGSILHQMSAWPQWRHLETYFARLNVVLERGTPLCDLLVVNPVESVWAQINLGWCNGLSASTPEIEALERTYQDVFHHLAGAGIDFDYGDEDHLARRGTVSDTTGVPTLELGRMRYRAVLVAGAETLRGSTCDLLERFAAAGGTVLFAGPPPTHVDAAPSARPAQLAARTVRCGSDRAGLVNAYRTRLPQPVQVVDADGMEASGYGFAAVKDVFCQGRREGATTWVVAINVDRTTPRNRLLVRVAADLAGPAPAVEEWDLLTGARRRIAALAHRDTLEWEADLPVGGSRCWRVVPAVRSDAPVAVPLVDGQRIPVPGPFAYRLHEPNVCLLDRARWRFAGGDWQPETEVLRIDRTVRDQAKLPRRGGEMVQPWFAAKHLPRPEPRGRLELAFDATVERLPDGAVELVLESPERFEVAVNGRNLDARTSPGFWIDIALKRLVLPAAALHHGVNTITLATEAAADLDLENLFLTGLFGVRLDGTRRILTALPATLAVGDLTTQGLPFYGAGLTLHLPVPAACRGGAPSVLEVPRFAASCLYVGADEPGHLIAWDPRRAEVGDLCRDQESLDLTVVLTRRNTFGPVHELPVKAESYHPDSFHSAGTRWSEPYALHPAGLLAAPAFVLRMPVPAAQFHSAVPELLKPELERSLRHMPADLDKKEAAAKTDPDTGDFYSSGHKVVRQVALTFDQSGAKGPFRAVVDDVSIGQE